MDSLLAFLLKVVAPLSGAGYAILRAGRAHDLAKRAYKSTIRPAVLFPRRKVSTVCYICRRPHKGGLDRPALEAAEQMGAKELTEHCRAGEQSTSFSVFNKGTGTARDCRVYFQPEATQKKGELMTDLVAQDQSAFPYRAAVNVSIPRSSDLNPGEKGELVVFPRFLLKVAREGIWQVRCVVITECKDLERSPHREYHDVLLTLGDLAAEGKRRFGLDLDFRGRLEVPRARRALLDELISLPPS